MSKLFNNLFGKREMRMSNSFHNLHYTVNSEGYEGSFYGLDIVPFM
jgi:hypothetical protein